MKFLLGLLLGLGLGAVIGLLIAPQSGKETLTQLSEQGILVSSGNFNEEIRARAQEALAQGLERYSRTKTELSDRYTRIKSGQY